MNFDLYMEPKAPYSVKAMEIHQFAEEVLGIHVIRHVRVMTHFHLEHITEEIFCAGIHQILAQEVLCNIAQTPDVTADYLFHADALSFWDSSDLAYIENCFHFAAGNEDTVIKVDHLILVDGLLSDEEFRSLNRYLGCDKIARKANCGLLQPDHQEIVGFRFMEWNDLQHFRAKLGLRMSDDDLRFCQNYFAESQERDPSLFELYLIDGLWQSEVSGKTMHSPFHDIDIEDETIYHSFEDYLSKKEELLSGHFRDVTLWDIVRLPNHYYKHIYPHDHTLVYSNNGLVALEVRPTDQENREKLCIQLHTCGLSGDWNMDMGALANRAGSGALLSALCERSYAFASMRVMAHPYVHADDTVNTTIQYRDAERNTTLSIRNYMDGSGIPVPISEIVTNDLYERAHMEMSCVLSCSVKEQITSWNLIPGDAIILLHAAEDRGILPKRNMSLPKIARSMQRLMWNTQTGKLIKTCSRCKKGGIIKVLLDLGRGLRLELSSLPVARNVSTYDEMLLYHYPDIMIAVVSQIHSAALSEAAERVGLCAESIGSIIGEDVIKIVDHSKTVSVLSKDFLISNGSEVMQSAKIGRIDASDLLYSNVERYSDSSALEILSKLLSDPNFASHKEYDGQMNFSVGRQTVLSPAGGKYQHTRPDFLCARIPFAIKDEYEATDAIATCAILPEITNVSPYHAAYLAVVYAAAKMVAAGCEPEGLCFSLQAEFPRDRDGKTDNGRSMAAALGFYQVLTDLNGRTVSLNYHSHDDSDGIHSAETLAAFGLSFLPEKNLIPGEFQGAGHRVYLLAPAYLDHQLPDTDELLGLFQYVHHLIKDRKLYSIRALGRGGIGEGICHMCFGNQIGFFFCFGMNKVHLLEQIFGGFLVECDDELEGEYLGMTKEGTNLGIGRETIPLQQLLTSWHLPMKRFFGHWNGEFRTHIVEVADGNGIRIAAAQSHFALPRVFLPVINSNHSEFDLEQVFLSARAFPKTVRLEEADLHLEEAAKTVIAELEQSQMLVLSEQCFGQNNFGPSCGKMNLLLHHPAVLEALRAFLWQRDGLILGVGGGFHVLLQSGLVSMTQSGAPCFGENDIWCARNPLGIPRSQLISLRVNSSRSPWYASMKPGDTFLNPLDLTIGALHMTDHAVRVLMKKGMIGSQLIDQNGNPTMDCDFNPTATAMAAESLLSEDGRILAKLCHFERLNESLCRNVPGNKYQPIAENGVKYFQ